MSHLNVDRRRELGREARRRAPRTSHAEFAPAPGRCDPVALLEGQNATRLPWLVPIRHARMSQSPFAFFRGAARVMAADLAGTPTSGLDVQAGGDAHLANFGTYASPERQLVFDANDFDETLRGPWEWDLKRLVASFAIAGRHLGVGRKPRSRIVAGVVAEYRTAMAEFAAMGFLDVWNDALVVDRVVDRVGGDDAEFRTQFERFERKARSRDNLQALRKLTEVGEDGQRRIRSQPPVLVPLRELPHEVTPEMLEAITREVFEGYGSSLADHRHLLLERYRLVDVALKVVGVGSVGTRCLVALLEGRDEGDPLFLQVKEAGPSVLEEHVGRSPYDHAGRRVVEGQRLIQAQSDIFLGWATSQRGVHFYVRQLRDWKGSADLESMTAERLALYGRLCGHTLARGHARSGDPAAISAYLGTSDRLDRALASFAEAYADQNETDFAAFTAAIDSGRIPVAAEA